jgi:4-amino-4-deoxy-L-arabinose transferase-like glycosyltransferase
VSAPDHAKAPAPHGLRVGSEPRFVRQRSSAADAHSALASRLAFGRWSAYAWGAIVAVIAFIALTCWWLTQDRSIPIYDAGDHLATAFEFHSMLHAGNLLGPLDQAGVYPPFAHLVGALATFLGGVNVASPIIGENLVFVPLLALGCYQTGRLLFGRLSGMLAAIFVLGSPLVISLFHVFMLDAPLAAIVAVSIWLALASEDFSRTGTSALAGLAFGVGFNVKSQFPLFLAGLIAIMLLHGGWRHWRGFAIFCVVALAIGTPWYIVHISELGTMLEVASSAPGVSANVPPTFSTQNFTWYFWSVLNTQLLAPLAILAFAGTLWTALATLRSRDRRGVRVEFLAGGFIAWLLITFVTAHHDIRYGLPLLAYVAVVGAGWIAFLPRAARLATIALLVLGVGANTLGITFGVGGEAKLALTQRLPDSQQLSDRIVLSTTTGFLASSPSRDGDVPGLLDALARQGVRTVTWSLAQSELADFSFEGLLPLARIAGLSPVVTPSPEFGRSASVATLIHESVKTHAPPPCTRVSNGTSVWVTHVRDGTGVWVVRWDAAAGKLAFYCPTRRPRFYDPGAVS